MACVTIALAAAVIGATFLLVPVTEAAARARIRVVDRRTRDPNKKPKT